MARQATKVKPRTSPTVGRTPPASSALQMDTLMNLVTGMGTERDKNTSTTFAFTVANKTDLDAAYRGDWISRKIVDIPAYDATREWRSWQAESTDITALTDLEKALKVQKKTQMALQRARLYGGAALIMGVNDGLAPDEPLDITRVGKDTFKWLHVVSRHEMQAGPIDWNVASDFFGQPAYYTRQLQMTVATAATKEQQAEAAAEAKRYGAGGQLKIHPSRIVRFNGLECPEMNMMDGWGDSVLQLCREAIVQLGTVSASLAALVQEAKIDIVKIPELSERMSNKDYEKRLTDRFALASVLKSIYSVMLLDKEEEWARVEQTFTGMPEVMQAFMMMVCGAADIPATRFMGEAPKGLSATGDSDTRNYYDKVSTEQETTVTPALDVLDVVLQMSALGAQPDGLFYEWNPLWQMDDVQRADIETKRAAVVAQDVSMGLIDPMVLQKARENQLIESGFYPGLEAIIEEYGTDYDERAQEAEAAAAEAAAAAGLDPNNPPDPNNPNAPVPPGGDPKAAANNNDPAAKAKPPVKKAVGDAGTEHDPSNGQFTSGGAMGPSYEEHAKNARTMGKKPMSKAAWEKNKKRQAKAGFAVRSDAITDMLKRIQDATTPRTLYVYRKVLNWQEIAKFYKAQDGVDTTVGSEMHTTIIYSKKAVDWIKVGEDNFSSTDADGNLTIKAGGPRVMEKFGNALVLAFASSDLAYRHNSAEYRADCTWDYDDYTPHITITYKGGAVDTLHMPAYTGEIVLGPEIFEEVSVGGFDPDSLKEA
jgi:phage-related protein (TIGR01555 family)